jgi:hypothetical protein
MSWQQWVLVIYMLGEIIRQFYMVDRPRETTGLGHAVAGLVEFSLVIALVVSA